MRKTEVDILENIYICCDAAEVGSKLCDCMTIALAARVLTGEMEMARDLKAFAPVMRSQARYHRYGAHLQNTVNTS